MTFVSSSAKIQIIKRAYQEQVHKCLVCLRCPRITAVTKTLLNQRLGFTKAFDVLNTRGEDLFERDSIEAFEKTEVPKALDFGQC